MIVIHDLALLPPLTWSPGGEGDCPHVLDEPPVRFYCTGEAGHAGDHAAEGSSGTVATWATGDPGEKADREAQAIVDGLAADVEAAFNPPPPTPRSRRLRRKRARK